MLAFLHTAAVHVPTFAGLMRQVAPLLEVRHEVREDLLARALADGRVTELTASNTQAAVKRLIAEGARVVACTCSTLGDAAEQTPDLGGVPVLRIDRPMAERAARLGRPVLVAAATPTGMATAIRLLNAALEGMSVRPEIRELACDAAWPLFQAGDLVGYAAFIAELVRGRALPNDVVMLAQASMAPAATLVGRTDIEVLTSPETGVLAAVAAHQQALPP